MKPIQISACILLITFFVSIDGHSQSKERVGGPCEGCEGIYAGMPHDLSWQTTLGGKNERGEPLEISGVIFKSDGSTPASNVVLYVYQTSARGYYEPAPHLTGAAKHHGRLRGWMKTNEKGEYKFRTIRPAPYPNADIPAHIHPIIKELNTREYWIDDFVFDDDPLLTQKERANCQNRAGSGILKLTKRADGLWLAKRDIILGLNIPNYQ